MVRPLTSAQIDDLLSHFPDPVATTRQGRL